jgi:hypothetical protein
VFASLFRQASLREDYLNQVQRDFLSLSFTAKTPLADVATNWRQQCRLQSRVDSITHPRACEGG